VPAPKGSRYYFGLAAHITCRIRSGSRRSGIASESRRHTPRLRSACRSSSRPPSEDWLPPAKSTVSFLRRTHPIGIKTSVACGAYPKSHCEWEAANRLAMTRLRRHPRCCAFIVFIAWSAPEGFCSRVHRQIPASVLLSRLDRHERYRDIFGSYPEKAPYRND
jgi:hypothetical protein